MNARTRWRRRHFRRAKPEVEGDAPPQPQQPARRPTRRGRGPSLAAWIRIAAAITAVVLVGALVFALRAGDVGLSGVSTSTGGSAVSASGPAAPDFTGIVDWENSPPLTMSGLRGRVVLVDFWTYSCINCQRTFPFLRQWWDRYRADGLVIVGVHSPEFEFEKNVSNIRHALTEYGVTWPVAVDSDMATWNAYQNQYWPAEYLIDATGHVRHTSFGEGDYATTERAIQQLLAEAGQPVSGPLASADPGITNDANNETPETYVGSARGDGSVNLGGAWDVQPEYAQLGSPSGAYAELQYTARRVFMVASATDGPVTVRVMLDGRDLTASQAGANVHVDAAGHSTAQVDHSDLYALISLPGFSRHVIRLIPEQSGFQLYTFTFGS